MEKNNENIKNAIIMALLILNDKYSKENVETIKNMILKRFRNYPNNEYILTHSELDLICKITNLFMTGGVKVYYPIYDIIKEYFDGNIETELNGDVRIIKKLTLEEVEEFLDHLLSKDTLKRIAIMYACDNPTQYITYTKIVYKNITDIIFNWKSILSEDEVNKIVEECMKKSSQ